MIESGDFWPPSSSGPGRGPLKAKTRIRIPLGAPKAIQREPDCFFDSKPGSHRGISIRIPLGAPKAIQVEPPGSMSFEEFLAMLRFEQRYKLAEFDYRDLLKDK